MRLRRVLAGVITGVILGSTAAAWSADTTKAKSADRGAAERNKRYARIEEKLAQVLANQQALLERSAALKEELQIIKVRATSRGGIQ